MRRRAVQVVVVLLHVLAVVALGAGEAEQPFLQDRVGAVPEGQAEAEQTLVVGDAQQAVLVPAIDARAGVLMREVVPGAAVGRVVLADGAPLALGQVGAPAVPGGALVARRFEAGAFGVAVGNHASAPSRTTAPLRAADRASVTTSTYTLIASAFAVRWPSISW